TNLLAARTGAFARRILKSEQTVRLSGTEPPSKIAYDPKFPAPLAFNIELSGIFKEGVASKADLESVLKDTAGIPPTRPGQAQAAINFDSLPPYAIKVLAAYKDDGGDSALRDKVREGIAALKENNQNLVETFIRNF